MLRTRIAAVALCTGVAVSGLGALPAQAAGHDQDGLVNVAVGDVNILNDANVGVAAQVAANVCGVEVGPVAVLGNAVDATGVTRTVCTTPTGPVTIEQNQ